MGDLGSKVGMGKPNEASYSVGVRVKDTSSAVATLLEIVTLISGSSSSASASPSKNSNVTTGTLWGRPSKNNNNYITVLRLLNYYYALVYATVFII